ncbi:MAG: acyl-CoA dehydratase activase [Pseudomonadota bacterium]
MKLFCGIDIGSSTIKIVLIDEKGDIIAKNITPSGHHYYRNASDALTRLLDMHRISKDNISLTVSTGYGRKLFKEADLNISEITANAMGVKRVEGHGTPVKTIINIGGQDSKVILLDDDGGVKEFCMNDKCAAGTGSFLEMTAKNMGVTLEELGRWRMDTGKIPVTINSTCTVFAASEIISLLADGYEKGEIIAGVHSAVARRVAHLAYRIDIKDRVLLDGGGAMNCGLKSALEDELMRDITVPEIPQITTAIGAALYAREGL